MEEPTATADELKAQVQADLNLYFQSDNAQQIYWELRFPEIPEGLWAAAELLTQPLEKPELSDREKRLLAFLQEHTGYYSQDATRTMLDNKWAFCPLCYESKFSIHFRQIEPLFKNKANRGVCHQ